MAASSTKAEAHITFYTCAVEFIESKRCTHIYLGKLIKIVLTRQVASAKKRRPLVNVMNMVSFKKMSNDFRYNCQFRLRGHAPGQPTVPLLHYQRPILRGETRRPRGTTNEGLFYSDFGSNPGNLRSSDFRAARDTFPEPIYDAADETSLLGT